MKSNNTDLLKDKAILSSPKYKEGAILFAFATIALASELLLPIVAARVNAAIVLLLLALITFIIINNIGFDKFCNLIFRFLPIFVVSLLYLFVDYIQGKSFIKAFFAFYKFFIWTIIIWYTVQSGNKRLAKGLLMAIISFYLITTITTQIGINLFPGICRAMTNSTEKDDTITSFAQQHNIGGFDFIYSIVVLIPLGVYLFKNKLFNRLLIIAILLPMVLMVFDAGFTTAILFTSISAFLFLFKKTFSINKFIGLSIISLIIMWPMMNVAGRLLMNLSDSIENRTVALRIYDLGASFSGVETSQNSDLDGRIELYKQDLNNFVEHPLFGSFTATGHSFVLDNLSAYGLFGFILLIVVFNSLFKHYIRPYKNSAAYGYLFFIFIIQIGLAILNPHLYLDVFVIVIPLILFVFENKQLPR